MYFHLKVYLIVIVGVFVYAFIRNIIDVRSPQVRTSALLFNKERSVGYRGIVFYSVVFRLQSGEEKTFSVTDEIYFSLPQPGYRGELNYQGSAFNSFEPYKDQQPGKLPKEPPCAS